mmetsp:Transcript_5449/g.8349  ORF Transcript_5449/g.8349 Transcript_5449/m.8349 type:complete len:171 (-) Transcript_5449:91-603(-)|eukprot:CAMPEP_0178911576 /NCGR_PEP_ID=MMETSP0786-20121207/9776_1 /TAXON_ID=186022 /ORGANISM="Thalassionema frauenfeldii, Strain CCMP 1798" /LENGTH=170 /DNA_ID=CAMNT_0020584047 /DNA_START=710 /DNA_END=1222 /DNA_ORIENTATION=-
MGFTMRKTIQSKRSGRRFGTCQLDLQFDNDKIMLPGESMPIDMEIAHSCYQTYAMNEIRIRLHEVLQSNNNSKNNNNKRSKSKDVKVYKHNIALPTTTTANKSGTMDIKGVLDIPSSVLCDSRRDGVHHYLEVKILSRGKEETLRFQFPLAIGKNTSSRPSSRRSSQALS